MTGKIVIDQKRCKGCGLCVAFCPQQIIALDTDKLNASGYHPAHLIENEQDCTGCTVCAVVCPDTCITVFREAKGKRLSVAIEEVV